MNKKIKFFLLLITFLFASNIIYAKTLNVTEDFYIIAANEEYSNNIDYGIYFTTGTLITNSTLSLEGDVFISTNQKGIYCGKGGALTLQNATNTDVTIYTSFNKAIGIQSQYAAGCLQTTEIDILDMNVHSDNDSKGLFTCGTMKIIAKTNKKTVTINNPKIAAIHVNANGIFLADNINITGCSAQEFFLLTGSTSSTTFKNTNIEINSDKGFLSQKNDNIFFINSNFKNKQEHFLTSEIDSKVYSNNSIIEGYIENNSNRVNFTLENNSIWKMKKSSKVEELNISNSSIDLSASSNTIFNTLTVEKLKGTGINEIKLNTKLNGEDSLTDKLVITNSVTGKFILNITNVGKQSEATQKNIKIIDTTVNNSADTFTLKNYLYVGDYVYNLQQGYGNDIYSWFLKPSLSEKSDTFVTISNTAQFMNFAVKTGMNEISKRLGDIRRTPLNKYNGIWVRTYGKNFNYERNLKTELNIFGIEAGYDFRINKTTSYIVEQEGGYDTVVKATNENRWYLGFMVGFQNISKIETEHKTSNKNGNGTGNSKSIGIYCSYIAQNGLFIDLTLRNFWIDFDMKTYSSSNEQISFKPQKIQTAFSIETGKEFLFGKSIIFEPKAEFLFAYSPETNLTASNNNKINYGSNILCNGKLGFMLGLLTNKIKTKNCLPYFEASYNYDFNNKADITYSDTNFQIAQNIDFSGGYFDLGLGLNAYFGKGLSCYGLISYEKGSEQNNIAYNIGIRYGF